jgi:tRNA threonylcarbamoyladenosine modification (KEOPS) complex Cgi121 subunit
LTTWHTLHGGIYTRTIRLSKGQIISTATINKPTTLTINGHILVYVGDSQQVIDGYGVIPASAGRKQIMVALKDTIISMAFATNAETIGEAEEEYTDSVENLSSRREDSTNYITVTGE